MNSESLTIQRTVWATKIAKALTPEFTFKQFRTDYDDTFIVNHGDSTPGAWRAEIKVTATVGKQNRIKFNGNPFSSCCSPEIVNDLMAAVRRIKTQQEQQAKNAQAREEEAARWLDRQEKELATLPELPGITLSIITNGTRAGDYNVSFDPGHPLETLSLKQAKEFFKFLTKDKPKSGV